MNLLSKLNYIKYLFQIFKERYQITHHSIVSKVFNTFGKQMGHADGMDSHSLIFISYVLLVFMP